MSSWRLTRSLLTALAVVAASTGLSGCGDDAREAASIAVIDVAPDEVDRIVFTDGTESTEIRRVDDDWLPGKGGSVESIALLGAAEDRLLPLNAYRIMDNVNQDDPNYGLAKPSRWSLEVFEQGGKRWHLSVGKPSFNQAGYYAKVDGDPRVYLIISKTVSDIISIANGQLFEFEPVDKIKFVDQYFNRAAQEGGEGDMPDYDPWLTQVLAARSGDEAKLHEAARKSSSILGPPDKGKITGEGAPKGPLVGGSDLSRSAVAPGNSQ